MKELNERCPLQCECERKCKFKLREKECDYYQGNARPGYEIPDQTPPFSYEHQEETAVSEASTTENTGGLVYIDADIIYPHPNNPRKDLGDLSELADSIKSRGILQNLTVVPQDIAKWNSLLKFHENLPDTASNYEGGYTVIIGHRRHAASKIAGLAKLPCTISDMDEKEQVATMLLENMQRNDLTVIEQAQGFQMMLDLGETTQTISKKTGFSETTVRKRLFVASLDANKSKSAYERGATLEDYMKLQQLTNEKKRNKVLESLGTNNFSQSLQGAIAEELRDRVAPKIIKQIKAFAKPTDKQSWELKGYSYHWRCSFEEYEKKGKLSIKLPKKWKPDEYLYHTSTYSIEIYKQQENFKAEKKMAELPPAEQEQRRETRRKYKALKEMGETTYRLRLDFVNSLPQKSSLNTVQLEALSEFAFASVCLGERLDFSYYVSLTELQIENTYQMDYSQRKEAVKNTKAPAARVLLASLYSTFRDSNENTYFYGAEASAERRGYHKTNGKLDAIYDCICALGYQMSDEEQALRDGTHELYMTDPGKDSDNKRQNGNGNKPEDGDSPCYLCKSAHPSCDKCCAVCEDKCNACQVCRKESEAES